MDTWTVRHPSTGASRLESSLVGSAIRSRRQGNTSDEGRSKGRRKGRKEKQEVPRQHRSIRPSLLVQGLSLPLHTGWHGPQSPSQYRAWVWEFDSCFKVGCTILCPLRTVAFLRKPVRDGQTRSSDLAPTIPSQLSPNYPRQRWLGKITIYFSYINLLKETLER